MPRPSRPLSTGEIALARSVFGDAIDYARVRVRHYKWIFFQPRRIVMAPMGDLHFHPKGGVYCDDFSCPAGGQAEELAAKPAAQPAAERVWKSKDGKFSVTASLSRFDGVTAHLQTSEGKAIAVPLSALSPEDQQFLKTRKIGN